MPNVFNFNDLYSIVHLVSNVNFGDTVQKKSKVAIFAESGASIGVPKRLLGSTKKPCFSDKAFNSRTVKRKAGKCLIFHSLYLHDFLHASTNSFALWRVAAA